MNDTLLQYQPNLPFKEPRKMSIAAKALNVEATLSELIKRDLTFKGERTAYATHNLHAFAAKFPPQLPRLFINELTQPGEYVLDPMSGSGTTLVEAMLADRCGIGVDLDPLASLITKVKSSPLNLLRCAQAGAAALLEAKKNLCPVGDDQLSCFYSPQAIKFFRYWFKDQTVNELFALVRAIKKVDEDAVRAALKVVFSSCIITKSSGLTLAKDLAHSRPHRDLSKQIRQSSFDVFKARLDAIIKALEHIMHASSPSYMIRADVRNLPLASGSVQLIITSPPYAANAIDYMRAHKFSLMWFGYEPKKLTSLRSSYIGAELRLPNLKLNSEMAQQVIHDLRQKDANRAAVVAYYFCEMEAALREMLRVLAEGRAAVLVAGSSIIRGIDIKAPTTLAELAAHVGFRVVRVVKREIVRDARMMPVSHNSARNGIEARMHEEGVIGLIKPIKG